MSTKTKRNPTRVTNPLTGERLVYVPLANHSECAVCNADDFERLIAAGVTDRWWLNAGDGQSYVRCKVRRFGTLETETVARLITSADPMHIVKYHNDRRLDLRRNNLRLVSSNQPTRGADLDLIAQSNILPANSQPQDHQQGAAAMPLPG